MPFVLTIQNSVKRLVSKREISARIARMMRDLQLDKEEVSFLLTDDNQIHELNKNYRQKDRPTDVLAFPLLEGELAQFRGALLGDVVLSVPTAARQAERAKKPVLQEITMLLAHGLLHLLGWDHDTPAKDRRMRAETDRLCRVAAATRESPSDPRARGPRKPRGRSRTARSSKRTDKPGKPRV